jgi:hypothetical protein
MVLDHLDLDGREPGETPIPHPLFIEQDGRRWRYPIQVKRDFQIAAALAQKLFGLLQCPVLSWKWRARCLTINGPDNDKLLRHVDLQWSI